MAGSSDPIANIPGLSPDLQRAFAAAVSADRKPIQMLNAQKQVVEKKVELLTDIVGKVDGVKALIPNLNSPIAIRELAVNSTDEHVISATADKTTAEPGTYNFEVLQLASEASALSNGFESKDNTRIGSGYFRFNVANGDTKEVFIDDENATLDGIARSINQARVGMKASVVNDQSDPDAPYRLVLTADGTGVKSNVEYPDFYFVDGESDFFIDKEKGATNARIRYDGLEVETPTNEVTDLIKGVTVNLKGLTEPGRPTSLTINQDIPKTTIKLKDLVDKLNGIFTFIQGQNKMDEKTQTVNTLGGEYSLRITEQKLRTALSQNFLNTPGRSIKMLSEVGIAFNKKGTLDFDEKKFQSAINGHFDEVVDLLSGDGTTYGVVPALSTALNAISGSQTGVLTNQKATQTEKISRLDKDIAKKEKSAADKQEALKGKLARAQVAINTIQNQGNYMQAQLGGGGGGSGGLIQQLLG